MTMEYRNFSVCIGVIICIIIRNSETFNCDRKPESTSGPSNKLDPGRYIIEIDGKPDNYVPEQQYKIYLKLPGYFPDPEGHKFRQFIITLKSWEKADDEGVTYNTGKFEINDYQLTKFSEICLNTVTEVNNAAKSEVMVYWNAPPPNSGCVLIKAAILENRENWFSDEDVDLQGPLTKYLCENKNDDEDKQPEILSICRACDEAKYEMEFEGAWTRNTHPKGFPLDLWTTRFSDIIGASHGNDKGFWEYDETSSEALAQLALEGTTEKLETELKENIDNLRTIIKARGIQYPNITSSTYAVFRVDPDNHLISIVSKFMPSPDWIVGVADLELCVNTETGGSWKQSRTLNLYPWDVGVDDAVEYTKIGSRTDTEITRLTSSYPDDPRSPFYGEDIKPLATLRVTLQKIYKKDCDTVRQTPTCTTSPWSRWSECNSSCGRGTKARTRYYLNNEDEETCHERLSESHECYGRNCHTEEATGEAEKNEENNSAPQPNGDVENNEQREIRTWSEWSSCSTTCGKGHKTRDLKVSNEETCMQIACEETVECELACDNEQDVRTTDCPNIIWSKWSRCSVRCGTGRKTRKRIPAPPISDDEESRSECPLVETVECYESCQPESESYIVERATGPVEDCKVSKWSRKWTPCDTGAQKCGRGYKYKHRRILVHPLNGGKPCPRDLIKRKECRVPCHREFYNYD